ncbi:hypothetical protein [Pseudaquabacterium pictum]|uniref:Restriction endonuclease type IV Mrr domain-containing protein n=1 Tax=Pseudaquabacterium pictum TaxID=2315236 RepID=A0A480APA7_9BURK|nr:hypothetical protein [Rubrivivax pictus]GCL62580.1 hypothetical protein AQPW35_16610 [Rubrivivax pictus]
MSSDGKQLEALVAFVEQELLPPGFTVKSNERVFNDEGVQIAEFDIEINGKIGSTTISWLIECRDRPGHGAAPGSWIEQLVGRRMRFGFNKVTAVSTTGFAAGAIDFAKQQGIELREVASLDPNEFKDRLHIMEMQQIRRVVDLKHASLILSPTLNDDLLEAALDVIAKAAGNDAILISSSTGERANLTQAFFAAIQSVNDAFKDVVVGQPCQVQLHSSYRDEDHFLIETPHGRVRVSNIDFIGELRVEECKVPVMKTAEYRHAETGEPISQLAAFAPQSILGMNLALELHRMADSGETHFTMRRLPDDA